MTAALGGHRHRLWHGEFGPEVSQVGMDQMWREGMDRYEIAEELPSLSTPSDSYGEVCE